MTGWTNTIWLQDLMTGLKYVKCCDLIILKKVFFSYSLGGSTLNKGTILLKVLLVPNALHFTAIKVAAKSSLGKNEIPS